MFSFNSPYIRSIIWLLKDLSTVFITSTNWIYPKVETGLHRIKNFNTLLSFNFANLLLTVLADIDVFLAISFISILGFDKRHFIIFRSVSESSCLLRRYDDDDDDDDGD